MQRFYGIMYNSDWLFSFEPQTGDFELIDRISAGPNRKSGNTFYSTLAFELSRDGKTIYYIPHCEVEDQDTTTTESELHLVTYNIPLRRYIDHGVIELTDGRIPRYCQGLEVGTDGNLYIVAWVYFTDLESEKGKKMLQAKTSAEDLGLSVERTIKLQEINLIEIKYPLANNK